MKKEGRREEILKAATRVFGSKGFHKARIEDIALEAGIGKSTVYEYFRSKRQLFDEMISWGIDVFLSQTAEEFEEIEDAREKLRSLVMFHYSFSKNYKDIAKIMIRSFAETHDDIFNKLMVFRKRILDFIAEIIKEGIDQGVFKKVDPYFAGILFMGILREVGMLMYVGLEVDQDALNKMLDYFLYGICTK